MREALLRVHHLTDPKTAGYLTRTVRHAEAPARYAESTAATALTE
jgi:hypothetical protein